MLLVLVSAATPSVFAQDDQGNEDDPGNQGGNSFAPLVYNVENTGAKFPAPNFPSFGQLPIIRPLPDPFEFNDGSRDHWFGSWERRRNEIKAAIEKYEIGPKPDCSDCTITSTYMPPVAGSNAGSLKVVVTRNGKSVTLNERVYIPQGMGSGPFPAMIAMTLSAFPPFFVPPFPNYGSLPSSVFSNLPIATVDFFHNDVTTYSFFGVIDHTKDAFYQLYPELCAGVCTGTSNSGQYAAWAWGVSRLIDGMEIAAHQAVNPLPIDMKHLAVTGCSYAGKMALFAGAFDERVALTIAQENGGGGAPSWRVSHEIEAQGTVEDIDDTDYNWFGGQMRQFAGPNVYKLPVDHHELMAMVAPRALLETGNTEFYYLSNGSNYVSARATQRIFKALGVGDRFGFYIDGNHGHCATLPAEAPAIASFVNRYMLGQQVDTEVAVFPNPADPADIVVAHGNYAYLFPTMDYKRWTHWWGSNEPVFPDNWNTGGTIIASLKGDDEDDLDMKINSGDLVEAGYELMLGGSHPAAKVSLSYNTSSMPPNLASDADITTDISCHDGSSYTLKIPLSAKQYSISAGDNSWQPTADPHSPLVFQGSATATPPAGASSCVAGRATQAYFRAMGISENGVGNPGGPGLLTSDVTDPLNLRFHVLDNNNGQGIGYGPAITINWNPLTSANSTNQNPIQ